MGKILPIKVQYIIVKSFLQKLSSCIGWSFAQTIKLRKIYFEIGHWL